MSLSQEEKEQVAVLLGWERQSEDDTGTMWWNPNVVGERRWQHPGHPIPDFPGVTLEACMEYAKGKGWDVYGIEWQADYERHEAYVCPDRNGSAYHAEDPDALTAFVRALLKAEEASRPQRWTRLEETLAGPDNNDDEVGTTGRIGGVVMSLLSFTIPTEEYGSECYPCQVGAGSERCECTDNRCHGCNEKIAFQYDVTVDGEHYHQTCAENRRLTYLEQLLLGDWEGHDDDE